MALPLVAIGAAGAASALGSSMFNASSVKSANDLKYKMFREQMQYDKQKFQREQYYNSYRHQMNDMKSAGLNPALMASGMSSAVSAGSVPSAPDISPVDYTGAFNAGTSLMEGLASINTQKANVEKIESETALNQIDAITRQQMNLGKIKNMSFDSRLKHATETYQERLARLAGVEIQTQEKIQGDKIEQEQWRSELLRAQAGAQLIANRFIEPQAQSQMALNAAQAAAAYASGKASLQLAHNSMMEVYAKYGGTKQDRSEFFKASLDYLIQQKKTAESQEFNNMYTPWSYSLGSKIFGSVSHQTVEGRHSEYEKWKRKR